jgi:hypothetical protein
VTASSVRQPAEHRLGRPTYLPTNHNCGRARRRPATADIVFRARQLRMWSSGACSILRTRWHESTLCPITQRLQARMKRTNRKWVNKPSTKYRVSQVLIVYATSVSTCLGRVDGSQSGSGGTRLNKRLLKGINKHTEVH